MYAPTNRAPAPALLKVSDDEDKCVGGRKGGDAGEGPALPTNQLGYIRPVLSYLAHDELPQPFPSHPFPPLPNS